MRKRYSDEEKYQIVERYYSGETVTEICAATRVAKSTLYIWFKPYRTNRTETGHIVSGTEFLRMKQRVEKLEEMVEILKKVTCSVSSPRKDKLDELAALHGQYSVRALCEALEVPRGTFYNHIFRAKGDNSSYQLRRDQLSEHIRKVFDESNQIYGASKITVILKEQGEQVSEKMVAELMQEMDLRSIRMSAKKVRSQLNRTKKQDSLKMNFSVDAPNRVWVSDTTYFKLNALKYYICVIIDLYARKAIAFGISRKHSTQLVTNTFERAYVARKPEEGLIFHSDRKAQFTSYAMAKLLKPLNIISSFSPTGSPRNNAVTESFFASMKREELYRVNYRSESEFKQRINEYIVFYNNERPHASLNYKTPDARESLFFESRNKKIIGK